MLKIETAAALLRKLSPLNLIADEQLRGGSDYLLGAEAIESVPPAFKRQESLFLSVDVGIEIVVFGPNGVRRIHRLEIEDQPCAIKFPGADIAQKTIEPYSAQQTSFKLHCVPIPFACPIRER